MRTRLAILAIGFLLCTAAATAQQVQLVHPPTTAPAAAVEDETRNAPLPARRGGVPATQAASAGRAATASSNPLDMKRMGIALAIVLAAMYVAHVVWKRLGMPGATNRNNGSLQVVSRLNLSPKQQLILVRVGRRVVLIGNSGAQLSTLCEIGDPEEAAGLLGQAVTERDDSLTAASFNAVLGGEEKRFEEESQIAEGPASDADAQHAEGQALASTRDELSDMMDKVRSLSRQFRPNPKGE
jgi:flagellar biosynthetic protein FliO